MDRARTLTDVRWLGDSQKQAHRFPKSVRLVLGKELTRVQMGLQPRDGKWLPEVGQGVQEIRIARNKEAYRVVYVATPKEELELAIKRFRELVRGRGKS